MDHPSHLPKIILASTSPFRKALLEKLQLPFETLKPEVDETPLETETVSEMVDRLSLAKARAAQHLIGQQNCLIIASDQTACFDNKAIGKPHHHDKAVAQLRAFSGNRVSFLTGLVVLNTQTNDVLQTQDITHVDFRQLSTTEIENYLTLEQPYQCAGSFKSEGLGITLFNSIDTRDPNALIGLPLIQLTSFLKQNGIPLPYLPPA